MCVWNTTQQFALSSLFGRILVSDTLFGTEVNIQHSSSLVICRLVFCLFCYDYCFCLFHGRLHCIVYGYTLVIEIPL